MTQVTLVKMVHGSQGHVGHRVTLCFFSSETWVTGSQNWVTYVTRATSVTLVDGSQGHVGHVEFFFNIRNMGHRDTRLGHVCDLGGFNNIDHIGTRVTGSRWSRGSRCVFSLQVRVF